MADYSISELPIEATTNDNTDLYEIAQSDGEGGYISAYKSHETLVDGLATEDDLASTQAEIDGHEANTSNPHGVTKSQVSLGNVPNVDATDRSNHTGSQAISTVTGLQTALDGKVDENSAISGSTKTKITFDSKGLVTAGANATQDDIGDGSTYKQYSSTEKAKLAGIATGATANDTDANLKNRGNHTGSQTASTISDFSTAADARINAQKGQNSGLASLDSGGKVPSSQLPAIALTDVSAVSSQSAQLALTAQEGDVAIRTDQNKSYVHNGGSAGTMDDWSELLTPTDSVLSVNSKTGAVTLTTSDIEEGSNLYYPSADKTKLAGIAAGAEQNINADWSAGSGDAHILNKPTLGTAAAADSTDFATAAQGATADSAVQPGDLGDLATRDLVAIADIDATGTASSSTYLRGDGAWETIDPGDSLPDQTGNSGKYLSTDGTDASWETVSTGGLGNLVEDTTPQLGGDLDLNSHAVGDATAADLTKLHAITPTATELNYVDGVTSAIQTQLDGKAASSHTHTASQITDFDTEVSNNTDVAANTTARHAALTVTDSSEIDLALTGQDLTASLKANSVDEGKLDASVNASLDLADSATQPGDLATVATSGAYTDLTGTPTLGTAAAADTGDFATSAQGTLADSAVQPGDLGDLASKDKAGVADIDATGTASSSTYLRGDGSWSTVSAGSGDTIYFNDLKTNQSGLTSSGITALTGSVNGSNATFTVSDGVYASGTLEVYLNGVLQVLGDAITETTPASGIFDFVTAPASGSQLYVRYAVQSTSSDTVVVADDLATVATTGAYSDLTGTPSIPATFDDLTDGTTNKAYTSTEKTKLSGIATSATANSSDATLLDRANHTGTQISSTISDFDSATDARIANAAGDSIASLTGGKVPTSQLPAVSLTTVQTAINQSAQLGLTTEEGDVVVRTDENKTYMRNSGTAGDMTDFTLLNTPTDAVTSVAGQTGVVVLTKSDVGLGNVDNTSNATERAATATLTNKTLTSPKINENVALTATATEINTLDGITSSTAELNILDGVTATAAELNALDGITSTVTELNYADGVTSAIQTQLDAKVGGTTNITVGTSAPGSPSTGWLWIDTN